MQSQYTPPNPEVPPTPRVVRCLSWCAVSSAVQAAEDKESLPDQRERNRQFIENLGHYYPGCVGELTTELEVVGTRSIIQIEDAKAKHQAYGTLLSLLKRRAVDAIVLRDTDRLGRNRALIASIEEEAAAAGVVVIPREGVRPPLDGTSDGHTLIQAFAGTMAQKYVRDLVTKRRTGMRGRVEHAKRFPMTPPFGYRAVYEGTPPRLAGYALDDAQAAIVRRIFDLYLEGHGMRAIADMLKEEGHPTPSMARWSADDPRARAAYWKWSMVLEIIKRAQVYAGYLTFNRDSRTQQPPILTEGDHPPILTREELAEVQRARTERTTAPRRRLFSGSTFCAMCGKPMQGHYRRPWNRPGVQIDTMRCHRCPQEIGESHLMAALIKALEVLENTNDAQLAAEERTHLDTGAQAREAEEAALGAELAKLEARREWLVSQLAAMRLTEDEFDREEKKRRKEVQRVDVALRRAQKARTADTEAAQRGERLAAVRASARTILEKANDHPDLVRPWLQRHVRLYVRKGYGDNRITVEWV